MDQKFYVYILMKVNLTERSVFRGSPEEKNGNAKNEF